MATREHEKKWDKKVQDSNDEMASIISEGVQKSWERVQRRTPKQRKGTGALGPIPNWFPDDNKWELEDYITKLRGEYPIAKIKKMMKEEKTKREETGELPSFDTQTRDDIMMLNIYDEVIRAGKEKGLVMLLGEETAKAITARVGRLKNGLQGIATIKLGAKERKKHIIQILSDFISASRRDHSDDQIIMKAVKHFESEPVDHGYGKSTIRSIFNKHLKGK